MSTVWEKLSHPLSTNLNLIDITEINDHQFAVLSIEEHIDNLCIHVYNTRYRRWVRPIIIPNRFLIPWVYDQLKLSMSYMDGLYVYCGSEIFRIDTVTRQQESVLDISNWWKRFKYSKIVTFDHKIYLISIAWGEKSKIHIHTLQEEFPENGLKEKLQINVGTFINNIHIQCDKAAMWIVGVQIIGVDTVTLEPLFLCTVVRDGNSLVINEQTRTITVQPSIGLNCIYHTLLMELSTTDVHTSELVILGTIVTKRNGAKCISNHCNIVASAGGEIRVGTTIPLHNQVHAITMEDGRYNSLLVHGFVRNKYKRHSLLPICLIDLMVHFYRHQQIFAIGKSNKEYIPSPHRGSNTVLHGMCKTTGEFIEFIATDFNNITDTDNYTETLGSL